MKESELAVHFINYFNEGFEIFKEVPNGSGIVDFYAFDGKYATAVEVKVTLSLALIEQGYTNLPYSHYSYIASPTRPGRMVLRLCADFGLGILVYNPHAYGESIVEELLRPRFNRKAMLPKFMAYHKESITGSQNDRMTGFKDFVREVLFACRRIERENPPKGVPLKDLYEKMDNRYYKTLTICKRNLYQWTRNGIIKEFSYSNGKIFLNFEYIKQQEIKEHNLKYGR